MCINLKGNCVMLNAQSLSSVENDNKVVSFKSTQTPQGYYAPTAPIGRDYYESQNKVKKPKDKEKILNTTLKILACVVALGTLPVLYFMGKKNVLESNYYKGLINKQAKDISLGSINNSSGIKELEKLKDPGKEEINLGAKTVSEMSKLFKDVSGEKSFDDIIMSDDLKKQLDEIVDHIKNAKSYDDLMIKINNAILFYGPPGTGKTTFVYALCKKLGVNPFVYDMGKMKGGYAGILEKNMDLAGDVFLEMHRAKRAKDPNHISVMFFDECDEVFQKPAGANKNSESSSLSRFKTILDNWKKEDGVFIFANTNFDIKDLDSAIQSRVTKKYIPKPLAEALSNNFFNHFNKASTEAKQKMGEDILKPSDRSKKFFEILAGNENRHFGYREMENISSKSSMTLDFSKTKPLDLNIFIKNAINAQKELGLTADEVKELQKLII